MDQFSGGRPTEENKNRDNPEASRKRFTSFLINKTADRRQEE
jgi:hypothetical protein